MGKIVTVASQKGGTGKSTYIFHLGHALHKLGKRVAMIDTDARQATLISYCGSRIINAKDEVLQAKGFELESFPESVLIKKDQPYRKAIAKLRESFDVTLIDTKGEFERFQLDLVRESDFVLLPIAANQTDYMHSDIVVEAIKDENVQREEEDKMDYTYLFQKVDTKTNSYKHFLEEVGSKHPLLSYMPLFDVIATITPYGFTTFDAAHNMAAMRKFIEGDWGRNTTIFKSKEIDKVNELVMQAAKDLLEKIHE